MEIKELKKLVRTMKKLGILEYEADGVKLRLADYDLSPRKTSKKQTTDPIPTHSDAQMPADGDMLFWSTDTFDSTMEGRKGPAVNEPK